MLVLDIGGRVFMEFKCRSNHIINTDHLLLWIERRWLEKINGVKVGDDFNLKPGFFSKLPFQTINSALSELQSTSRQFGEGHFKVLFVRYEQTIAIDQDAIHPNVEWK